MPTEAWLTIPHQWPAGAFARPAPALTDKEHLMWYFAWMLGLPLAAAFAILNAMWFELMEDEAEKKKARG